ncbi:Mis12 protein-domain-containing protein, partial [Abortiporus biennis]
VPSVLLPELLGFVPQYLLDDIIDTANDEARIAVDAMEAFLHKWVQTRKSDSNPSSSSNDWDPTTEIEQGLVAFQTLLYSHVDIAFDFFEAWSLRNIFNINPPPDQLPLVVPHQQGLDLEDEKGREKEVDLLAEIGELRRKLNAQRKLNRLYTLTVLKSKHQATLSKTRLQKISFLLSPPSASPSSSSPLETLTTLPNKFASLYAAIQSLPPLDPTPSSVTNSSQSLMESGKRPWEVSKSGYLSWAIGELIHRSRQRENQQQGVQGGSWEVSRLVESIEGVANVGDLRGILSA